MHIPGDEYIGYQRFSAGVVVRMAKSCGDERFDKLCVTTSFLKRRRMDGASISILLGARVHLGNTVSVRKVRVKLYQKLIYLCFPTECLDFEISWILVRM